MNLVLYLKWHQEGRGRGGMSVMNGPGGQSFWKGQAVGCICCGPGVGTWMSSAQQWLVCWGGFLGWIGALGLGWRGGGCPQSCCLEHREREREN